MLRHENLILFFIIMTVCSFIGEFSGLSLIFFAVGFSLTVTVLDISLNKGEFMMKKITKRILLAIGIILCTTALFGEVSVIGIILFFIGFSGAIWTLNAKSEEMINEKKENNHAQKHT